jgi:hypothetical protein
MLKRGAHAGAVIDIVRVNKTGAIVRTLSGGSALGKQKIDGSEHRVPLEQFEGGRYVPYSSLETPNGPGGAGFRKRTVSRPAPPETGTPLPPLPAGELHMQVVDVTPAQAQAWLDNGGANRKLKPATVNRYAVYMLRGEWRMTGEPVKLDREARVRDGQHRLAAIVQSGLTVPMLVIRGVSEESFDVMDSGKVRTPADVLSIHGLTSTAGKSSAVRALMLIERFGTVNASTVEGRAMATGPTVLAYLAEHPEVEEVYPLAMELSSAGLQGGPGVWCAVMVLLWRIDQDAVREMTNYLKSGAGLDAGHPLLALRNRAMNREARLYTRSALGREEIAGMIIKAWNAWRKGEAITRLTWRPKEPSLPEIEGAAPPPVKRIKLASSS